MVVQPYFLKEYQGRWYLGCKFEGGKKFYCYALDRIFDLEMTAETFVPKSPPDPNEFFSAVIGVSEPDGEAEKVLLSVTHDQVKYFKTLPLHSSQKIVRENKTETVLSLKVTPNFDLIHRILMHGPSVKVMEPSWLVEDVKALLTEALAKYNS